MGEEKQTGTHKYEPEPNEDRPKPMWAGVASDLNNVGVQQKPWPLVMGLNTNAPETEKLKEVPGKVEQLKMQIKENMCITKWLLFPFHSPNLPSVLVQPN